MKTESDGVQDLVTAYLKRTEGSYRFAEESSDFHVDKSSIVFGATEDTQKLAYPFVIERAEGSRVWDIDGNEYIDILQGLGANLFGHNPSFIRERLSEAMKKGFAIGTQTTLVAEVSRLIHDLTGMPKVCFSNTGTEAIMTAIRIARAKTNRSKIVIFKDSYHGHVDWVIMRPSIAEIVRQRIVSRLGELGLSAIGSVFKGLHFTRAIPASVGIPNSMAKDVMVLNYGCSKSLNIIKKHRSKIAAVLVEPVQSRKPEIQPKEFLQSLREVTSHAGIGLIFDEMVTGFRTHPGGAQAYFDVKADLVTYSKIAGGGLPLSIVAGREDFMSYLQPTAGVERDRSIFFAGTFCKHPLSLVASHATMQELISRGNSLQQGLNQKVANMIENLNDLTNSYKIPVRFTHFGSFFSISLSESRMRPSQVNQLSYYLRYSGIHLRGGDRGGFLTTAHTDDEIRTINQTFINGLRFVYGQKSWAETKSSGTLEHQEYERTY
ncbi:MAG: aminotransferase class III-fold pyridoxal phosphate-dependent enzyme [Verrucomicrobiota bacterium]